MTSLSLRTSTPKPACLLQSFFPNRCPRIHSCFLRNGSELRVPGTCSRIRMRWCWRRRARLATRQLASSCASIWSPPRVTSCSSRTTSHARDRNSRQHHGQRRSFTGTPCQDRFASKDLSCARPRRKAMRTSQAGRLPVASVPGPANKAGHWLRVQHLRRRLRQWKSVSTCRPVQPLVMYLALPTGEDFVCGPIRLSSGWKDPAAPTIVRGGRGRWRQRTPAVSIRARGKARG